MKAAERAATAKVSMLESFDSGDGTAFWSTWTGSVPPHLISSRRENKALKFMFHIHFATYALKLRVVKDPTSPFPCNPDESDALSELKGVLHDASEDEEVRECESGFHISVAPLTPPLVAVAVAFSSQVMSEASLFAYFTLGSITHPHQHATFTTSGNPAAVFETDKAGGFLANTWTLNLRASLDNFCDNRLPLVTPPRLVTLFQAFHKWETSLQGHVLESVKLCNAFHEVALELLGQNVKLVSDMASGSAPSATYMSNMKRFIISKKHQVSS